MESTWNNFRHDSVIHLILLIKIISVTDREYKFELGKRQLEDKRKEQKVCDTKYLFCWFTAYFSVILTFLTTGDEFLKHLSVTVQKYITADSSRRRLLKKAPEN